jgi:hypothetical protein
MSIPLHHWIWAAALLGACALAFRRGGAPERLAAAGALAAWIVTVLVQDKRAFFDPQLGILAVDISFLGFLIWLALTRDRLWLLFAAAFQLLSVVTHMAIVAENEVRNLAYLRSLALWGYLFVIALAVGAMTASPRKPPRR